MAKKNAQPKQPTPNPPLMDLNPINQLQAIKEIIIGPELADIVARLNQLQEQIDQQKAATDDNLQTLDKEIAEKLEQLNAQLGQSIQEKHETVLQKLDNQENSKVNKKDLGEMFMTLGKLLTGEE